ncbi:MAG: ATP-binding protein [Pseudomonadota bacterium]|nr:ATP-binding protein [Pseudomonadota bacterium]MDE3038077.1 ATP-binding protein [Pseudomonadota bacterium]
MTSQDEIRMLQRIAVAVEKLAPAPEEPVDVKSADAYTWDPAHKALRPVAETAHLDLKLLMGIDQAKDTLLANTRQFARGHSANNALLWGARGMGKSSLVKAVHAAVNRETPHSLVLVEIHREDVRTLPQLLTALRGWVIRRFILFCDDLSFDHEDSSYKSLRGVLEGGIEGRPSHVLFYATSNRRHLMPRDMIENEQRTAIQPGEAVEEKISLSDRFGLWLGFHACSQETYLAIVECYAGHYTLGITLNNLHVQALEWAAARGARSGRVAWQFIQDLAGKMGKRM